MNPDDRSRHEARRELTHLAETITAARAAGDRLVESEAHARQAAIHTTLGDLSAAITALRAAVACGDALWETAPHPDTDGHTPAGRHLPWMRHRYGLALLLAREPATRAEARELFEAAATDAHAFNRFEPRQDLRAVFIKAYTRLYDAALEASDWSGAVSQATILINALDEWPEEKPALYEALRKLARAQQLLGLAEHNRFIVEKAVAAQTRAVKVALELRDAAATIRARLELQALHNLMGRHAEPIAFSRLIDLAREAGDEALVGDLMLERAATALREGRLAQGELHAQELRRRALEQREPTRYLLACMLIAEARERQDDRPGVIEILLTCKATLEAEVGLGIGEQIKLVLDSLADRWGRATMTEALRTYRQRMGAGHA
ncbi:MAG: hypothetical protein H6701_13510 [Myxococcales bacterium]|nr:hypothetical protein [Myxococcales bacterium]